MRVPWWVWWLRGELSHRAALMSYAVRPYDMIADRRRWFWQPRTPCGFMKRRG